MTVNPIYLHYRVGLGLTSHPSGSTQRRPLKSRVSRWATAFSRYLATTRVTPNQISQLGLVAAAASGLAFYFGGQSVGVFRHVLLVVALAFCQLRLLCNLLDGMVAVEGGKAQVDGAFWNEVPDRLSDILILAGLGYGIGAPSLGWAVAAFSVLTAYIREVGGSTDFSGPLAKPHRMAAVTAGTVLSLFTSLATVSNLILIAALWLILAGTVLTALRRALRLVGRDVHARENQSCTQELPGRAEDTCTFNHSGLRRIEP